jgi:glucose-6-phosphate dehydrogenase assembly protein OpcA
MATNYKVLGQLAPSATTATTLYTVPSATEAVISTLIVANRATSAAAFRIAVRPNGATLANEHYIAYDVAVGASDSTTLTLGLTLDAADVITVYASTANLSFSLFGSEITA